MQNRLLDTFFTVYPFENDLKEGEINNPVEMYRSSVFTQVISFMGFTNDYLPGETNPVKIFFRNLFGWPADNASVLRKVGAVLAAPFYLLFNIIKVAGALPVNILKLVTEFAPLLAANLLESYKVASTIFDVLHFIGSAITSPFNSSKRQWDKREQNAPRALLLLGLSLAITIVVYALLFPVVLKLAIVKLPIVAPRAVGYLAHHLSPVLKPVLNELGKHAVHVLEAIMQRISGIFRVVSGYIIKTVRDLIASCKKPKEVSAPVPVSVPVPVKNKAPEPSCFNINLSSKKLVAIFGFTKKENVDPPLSQIIPTIKQQVRVPPSQQRAFSSASRHQ